MKRRPLILGSAPRSGSTFVMQILNLHPRIAISYETDLLGILAKILRKSEKKNISERWLVPREKFTHEDLEGRIFTKEKCFEPVLEGLYRPLFPEKEWDAPVWVGDKWHSFPPEALRLLKIYGFRVIWITRNPVDMVASAMERRRHEDVRFADTPEAAMSKWYAAFSLAQMGLRVDTLHLQYEEVILRPERAFGEICNFLGVDGARAMASEAKRLGNPDMHHRTGLKEKWRPWFRYHPCVNEYKMFLRKTGLAPESLVSLRGI